MSSREALTVKTCMERHHKSRDTILNDFRKKSCPAFKIGREWQVYEDEWDEWLKTNERTRNSKARA